MSSRWLVFFPILLLLAGCAKVTHKEDPIFDAVRAQVKALNRRDAAGAIAMMHPEAPGLDRTRETTEKVTSTFDLLYMIQDLTLESADDNEAKVRFTQITQKVSGPREPEKVDLVFHNNKVVGIHTLRKYQGAWRIYYTQVLKIDYLDDK